MKIYNTLTRRLEDFMPLDKNHVRMYTCGPTVYDYAHIGNYRAYMFEDLLRKYLKFSGFNVTQVMNLTDVDDKTIKGARDAGISLKEYTGKYAEAFFEDLKTLNIEPAEFYPTATEHIDEMIELIDRLFKAGYAYDSDDGSVYFNVKKFSGYGKLSHIDLSGLRAGARVVQDEYDKENLADFALWKAWNEQDGDVAWDSPWGKGRPGWHIECSAMSMKYLGESFDLHTGGVDNVFPHHENEIAQSEGATGKDFVKYWMHCAHLIVDGNKMSKSLGNFYTLHDILERGYSGREIRYVLISAHYRQPLNFSFDALNAARSALSRLDEFRERLGQSAPAAADNGPLTLPEWAKSAYDRFRSALDDDLNTPETLGALFEMVHAGNKAMDSGKLDPAEAAGVVGVLHDIDRVLGIIAGPLPAPTEREAALSDQEVMMLVERRESARKTKDWEESDRIRNKLAELGWEVRDTAEGQRVKKRK